MKYKNSSYLLYIKIIIFQVDLWSAGCVILEIILGYNALKGKTEKEQMEKIFELCGSEVSDDVLKLPNYKE